MRKSVARRAAVKAATFASILLLTPLTGSTQATAAPPPQLSTDALPAELAQAISRDLGISPQEYLKRSARAQELTGYARAFRTQRPDTFAGAWIGPDGQPVIAVTSDDAARVAAADGYQTRISPVSANALEVALNQVNTWVADLPGDLATAVNSVAIDFLNSQLVVSVANNPVGHMLNLPTLIANIKVVLSPDGGGPVERRPMGGDTYISAPESLQDAKLSSVDVCSFGFNSTDSQGNNLNISAGHCNPNLGKGNQSASVYQPNLRDIPASPQLGTFVKTRLGGAGALDYSVIKLNDRAVRAGMDSPTVRGANRTTLTITGTAEPITGAPVCKTGQSSTFTCGYVVSDHVETQLHTVEGERKIIRGFASSACTLGGDSGGAIVSGTLALGITSGSNAANAPNCAQANTSLAPYGGTASLGIPIRTILADIHGSAGGGLGNGITVRTRPNAG